MKVLETQRLLLRDFNLEDLDAMTAINQDPLVMKYFPSIGDKEQTEAHINRIKAHQKKYGYSLYAVELKSNREMIGFVGLLHRTKEEFDVPFMPATEIGWRLSSQHWNHGYATEVARAVLHYAFTQLNLAEVISFTVVDNLSSRRVMEKIGLHHNPADDFDHPKIDKTSALCRHVLYRISQKEYGDRKSSDDVAYAKNKPDRKITFNKRAILQLNNLSKEINALYGYAEIDGEREPAINVGPCGPFANTFFHLWNRSFSEKVNMVFIFKINSDKCWHIAIRLPNGSLFDGGVGVHDENYYGDRFYISDMKRFDPTLLEKNSHGLKRSYPRYCATFSVETIESMISKCLRKIQSNGVEND